MNTYLKAFLIAGLAIPIGLHLLARDAMPWWPDTVSMGIGFGAVAIVIVSKYRTDREMKRRMWNALKGAFSNRTRL